MAPSGVNDAWRAGMGAIMRWWNRANGRYASTGTTPNYVLTPTVALAAYVTGERYSFRANFTCGATPTLNISALGAKNIKKFVNGTTKANLAANDIMSGQAVTVEYDGTDMLMVTPTAGLIDSSTTATTSASGIIELATQAEVDTGTDAVRAVTPSTLTGWTPGVGSVTLDPANDEVLIRDASASNVLKRAALTALAAAQADQETGTSTTLYVTPGRQHFHNSAAKAWVNFDSAGINADYGVTSVANNATGDNTITFDSTFAANFAWAGSAKSTSDVEDNQVLICEKSRSTTTLVVRTVSNGDSGSTNTFVNVDPMSVVVYGDI